jgi:hypothetical protein
MKPKLKPPGTKRLKLNCHEPLSTSAFKFNLRRYTKAFTKLEPKKGNTKDKEKDTSRRAPGAMGQFHLLIGRAWKQAGPYTHPIHPLHSPYTSKHPLNTSQTLPEPRKHPLSPVETPHNHALNSPKRPLNNPQTPLKHPLNNP